MTFLFTDVEGSTKLLFDLGAEGYASALAAHRRVLRQALGTHQGVEVDTQGDAFFIAFPTASGALAAAASATEQFSTGPILVRMGLHTGTPFLDGEGYVGVDVHRAARIAAAGHGGQVLISASTAALLGTEGLRDLGEHRLKDLGAAERVYQLGERDFPPLKSLYRTNLPVPATPFLGRLRELGAVCELLKGTRLLTLTGPGGTGKTRLALQVAAEVAEHHPDGVFWIPLAALRNHNLVLDTIGHAVGAKDGLAEHLAAKSILLVVDNFEHVIGAAPDLSDLLASCPNLHLLVTSRELLRLPGEQAYPVPPLDPEDGTHLFVSRACAALPSFTASDAVEELCRRLENLPLAIELAAARVRVLSPEQLLELLSQRLDVLKAGRGVDPRQQTLRATIEWSHELLDKNEQRLFARLAVFVGGSTFVSAQAVCDADLDTLESLVDKSLVRIREGDRFWMLETIREYAAERLNDSGEAETLRWHHAQHFVTFGEQAERNTRSYSSEWIARLDREHDNLRTALDHLAGAGEYELVLGLAGALANFWCEGGHVAEGRQRLDRALQNSTAPTAARARALSGAALLAYVSGDVVAARPTAERALELHRRLGDPRGAALDLNTLCVVSIEEGDHPRARDLAEESLALFREAGDADNILAATRTLAFTHQSSGDVERARELHEANLAHAQALGSKEAAASTLGSLAMIAFEQGRIEDALELGKQNLIAWRDLHSLQGIAMGLCRRACLIAALPGKAATATQLLSFFETLRNDVGVGEAWVARMNEQTMSAIKDQIDDEAYAKAWERGQVLGLDQAVALALEELG